jgi:arabinofuranosyltransferase
VSVRRAILRAEVLIGAAAFVARILPGPRTIDDAYITFRYARNILAGLGPVYNPGEAVLGTTTPLYMALMSALGLVSGGSHAPFPILAWLVNAAADAITCWLVIRLAQALGRRNAGLAAAAVWAIAPWSVTFAIGGMETSVFVLLASATFYFHSTDRPIPAALSGALALLTRPDALLFLVPLALDRVRRSLPASRINPEPLRIRAMEAAAFLAPVLAWVIFSVAVFGSPLPHSITAKVAAYHLPREAALVRLLQHYATPFLEDQVFGNAWIGLGFVGYLVLFLAGAASVVRHKSAAWAVLVYPWVYFAAYAIANPLIFRWYLTPPLPILFLGIFFGVDRVSRGLRLRALTLALGVVATILTLNAWIWSPDHGPQRPAPAMAFIRLELLYEQAAATLVPRLQPGQVLAAGDVGVLGYQTGARILDTVGLVTPQSPKYYPLPDAAYVINYAIPAALIDDARPDFVVFPEVYGRNTLLVDPAFAAGYQLLVTLPTDIYGSRGLLIYQRRRPN